MAETVRAKKVEVDTADAENASLGTAVIPEGETKVTVQSSAATDKSQVFVTARSKSDGQPLYVSEVKEGSFIVEFEEAYEADIGFQWLVVS